MKGFIKTLKGLIFTMEGTVRITNPAGLHARPAALLVQKAKAFPCNISVIKDGTKANAKSIMSVMALGVGQNQQVTIVTEGEKETDALQVIVEFLAGFKE